MPSIMQPRFGEDAYPIGRFILDRAKSLGLSRADLVRQFEYRDASSGQRALTGLLQTGVFPSHHISKVTSNVLGAPGGTLTERTRTCALSSGTAYFGRGMSDT